MSFNPNKTFGGARSKPIDFQPKFDVEGIEKKDYHVQR